MKTHHTVASLYLITVVWEVGLMKGIQVKTIAQHFLLHFYECFLSFQSEKRTRAFDKH